METKTMGAVGALAVAAALLAGPPPSPAKPQMSANTEIRGWRTDSKTSPAGARTKDRVRVVTDGAGARRRVRLQRKRHSATKWRTRWTRRTNRRGRIAVSLRAPRSGAWEYRLRVLANRKAGSAVSGVRRIRASSRPTPADPTPTAIAYVAGDIGECGGGADRTARLIGPDGVVFAAGDLAYPDGAPADFADCYDPYWGRFKQRTRPVPGNHDYRTAGAAGYFDYFGDRAGSPGASWYALDYGQWRFFMLDSNCDVVGCRPGSAQYDWLAKKLRSEDTPRCTAAVWHHPRWSSGYHGPQDAVSDLYALLDSGGVDVLLSGHDHGYERFEPLSPDGLPDPAGPRQFVVGTGGFPLGVFNAAQPGSVVRSLASHGVLRLDLGPVDYRWEFLPTDEVRTVDKGTASCR